MLRIVRSVPTGVALLLMVTAIPTTAATLAAPADLTVADPRAVVVSHLRPGERVELRTIRGIDGDRSRWVGRAQFRADGAGRVDLASAAPLTGSYSGVDKAGIFWSARPVAGNATLPLTAAGYVAIEASVGGRIVARARSRTVPDPGGILISRTTPFPGGVFARPSGSARLPALIVLGGSEGGSYVARTFAPIFAARGYAVLGLPYYSPGYDPTDRIAKLPASFTNIPVDRLARVREWLAARPDIDAAHIGIWGVSKGAEFAMVAASRFPWIAAAAAIVPSDVVWEGWGGHGPRTASFAFDGIPLPFVPYVGMDAVMAKANRGESVAFIGPHVAGRAAYPARVVAARIPIERYRGALLVAGAGKDRVWPSLAMTAHIAAERRAAGLPVTALEFRNAGHLLGGDGYEPTAQMVADGGTPASIAHARATTWRATLTLFARTLQRGQ